PYTYTLSLHDALPICFGNATSFEYKPLNSISGCYSRDAAAPTFPAQAYMQPMKVVCKMISSDGIGGTYSHAYHYSNAALHLQGRDRKSTRLNSSHVKI